MTYTLPAQLPNRLFYYPVEKEGDHFVQADLNLLGGELLQVPDLSKYLTDHFRSVRSAVFYGGQAHSLEVFEPVDVDDFAYILVDETYTPIAEMQPISVTGDALALYLHRLSENISHSEGLLPEQRLHIWSSFLSPRLSILHVDPKMKQDARTLDEAKSTSVTWERLSSSVRAVLVGEAGTGKTTCVRRMLLEKADQGLRSCVSRAVPIYVQLRNWALDFDVEHNLRRQLLADGADAIARRFDELANEGAFLVCFDGIDEVSDDNRARVKASISAFARLRQRIMVILTSRPAAFGSPLEGFHHFRLEPFKSEQSRELSFWRLGKRYELERFWGRMEDESDLCELVSNPLLLTLILARYQRKETNPHFVTEVLADWTEALLGAWDSSRGVSRCAKTWAAPARKLAVLSRLALYLVKSGKVSFTLSDVEDSHKEYAGTKPTYEMLSAIESHTGLIRRSGRTSWAFCHKSLLEYFAARSLVDSSTELGTLFSDLGEGGTQDRFWQFSCGLTSEATPMLKTALVQSRAHPDRMALALAGVLSQMLNIKEATLEQCVGVFIECISRFFNELGIEIEKRAELPPSHEHWSVRYTCQKATQDVRKQIGDIVRSVYRLRDGVARSLLQERLSKSDDERIALLADCLLFDGKIEERRVTTANENSVSFSVEAREKNDH